MPNSPGDVISDEIPDAHGRPWPDLWEKRFEDGMERPAEGDIFDFEQARSVARTLELWHGSALEVEFNVS